MTSKEQSPWSDDEKGYREYLAGERHMFAWCLVTHAGMPRLDASRSADEFYPYESADDPMRGSVFHDEAWHWAMLKIFGDGYWRSRPELTRPSDAYRAEAKKRPHTDEEEA